ncbi:MAG TPA: HXXEE domain-containing protein [Reyranella sp.]|nr:HXXEE domain-containing protein [Reyranella sp.]
MRFERFVWLFPAVYALHIVEEYGTGFPAWMTRHMHASMDNPGFLLNNALFMAILLATTAWASLSRSCLSAFIFLSWASGNLFWNFIFHLVTTLHADSYSPGLVTASLLYYPVSLWGGVLAVRQERLRVSGVLGAFAIGAALMMFVVWAGLWHFHRP